MDKPDVDSIEGLSPAISIDQKTTSRNPRSTVGTVTEIYNYIRLLYARVGTAYCPNCGKKIEKQTVDQIVDDVMKLEEGTRIQKLIENYEKNGFVRIRVDGEIYEITDDIDIDRKKKHSIDIIIDRLVIKDDIRARLTESIEIAMKAADNLVTIATKDGEKLYSGNYACPDCGISFSEITPRMFSFNSPEGCFHLIAQKELVQNVLELDI